MGNGKYVSIPPWKWRFCGRFWRFEDTIHNYFLKKPKELLKIENGDLGAGPALAIGQEGDGHGQQKPIGHHRPSPLVPLVGSICEKDIFLRYLCCSALKRSRICRVWGFERLKLKEQQTSPWILAQLLSGAFAHIHHRPSVSWSYIF